VLAKAFIDCSYEGDLMARSGVSYTFGRESREQYGESLAGVRPPLAVYDIDPYVKPGEPRSGLIPLLQDIQLGPEGSTDKLTMAYGWRWKLAEKGERIPMEPPADYDPRLFELFRRGFAAQVDMSRGQVMHKLGVYEPTSGSFYGSNSSRSLMAQSIAGCNADYPDGDWPTRARIWTFHQEFIRGLTRFLQTDPAVPGGWKNRAQNMGFPPGHFDESGGWPHQLYVREARRMKASYILTQKDLEGQTDPSESVGLGSYGVDDWPYATYAVDGKVAINGGEFSVLRLTKEHGGAYKIPYGAITPIASECTNLLVPVCCSASHIAMTSTRMEPVWMILGESAGVAAALAGKSGVPVQAVQYPMLRSKLLTLGQRLDRPL
jgi:hypothetical protein